MAIDLRQSQFAFGLDDGTEASHTIGTIGANFVAPLDTPFLIRFAIWETGGSNALNLVQQFQYSRNGGTWTDITTTSTVVKSVAVGAFTNGQNCTQRLSAHGTFESSGAGCTEDGSSGGNANDLQANGSTETECGIQIISTDVEQGDDIEFRVRVTGPTTTIAYDTSPHAFVPVSKAPASASLSISGTQPTRLTNHIRAAVLGAVVLAGLIPTATVAAPDMTIPVSTGYVSATGQAPKIPALTVELREGTTLRATRYVSLTSAHATTEFALETAERNAIENWTNLRLSFIANGGQAQVAWSELEAPAATATAWTEAPAIVSIAFAGTTPTASVIAPNAVVYPPVGSMSAAGTTPLGLSFAVQLWCGSDLIATRSIALTGSYTTYAFELEDSERAAVLDWSDLSLSFIANGRQAEVSWAELEAAVAAEAQTVAPSVGALGLSGQSVLSYSDIPITASPGTGSLSLNGTVTPRSEVQLWMGPSSTGTLITSRTVSFDSSFTTYSLQLTYAEFLSVTDWSDLHVVIVADGQRIYVSWVDIIAPEPGASPASASLTFAGVAPLPSPLKAGTAAEVSLSGQAPTLARTIRVSPPVGSMALSGVDPASIASSEPGVGAMTLSGSRPLVSVQPNPTIVPVVSGEMSLAGVAPAATTQRTVAPGAGSITFAGVAPSTRRTFLATPALALLALSGRSPLPSVSTPVDTVVTEDVAELALSGGALSIVQAEIGPVALRWGSEALVVAHVSTDSLVSARLTGDTLEYLA